MDGWVAWSVIATVTVVVHALVWLTASRSSRAAVAVGERRQCPYCEEAHREPAWLSTPLECRNASFVFKLDLVYLVLLLALLPSLWLNDVGNIRDNVGNPVAGIVPVGVLLAGALGGVTISMYGVFQYNDRWTASLNYWHVARPFMGALLGAVGFVVYVATVQATGTDGDVVTGAAGEELLFYYVIAFVVGYREETFRELIKRAADLVLKPESLAVRASLVANPPRGVKPLEVRFDASGSVNVVRWSINYGDSTGTTECSGPPGVTTHTYEKAGTFVAMLSVTGAGGETAVQSAEIVVLGADEAPAVGPGTAAAGTAEPPPPPSSAAPPPEAEDPGVARLRAATSDEDRRRIERELIEETDKHVEDTGADDG